MRLIDADSLDITTITTDDYSGNEILDVVMKEDIDDAPTVEAIPKYQYEARLKADMVAMLSEIQLEIEEIEIDNNVPFGFEPVSKTSAFYEGVSASSKVIQQKIDELKEE